MPTPVTGYVNIPPPVHPSQAKYPHINIAIPNPGDRTELQHVIEERARIKEQRATLKARDNDLKLEQMVLMDVYKANLFNRTLRLDKWNARLTSGTSAGQLKKDLFIAHGIALDIIAACTTPGTTWESCVVVDATKPKGKHERDDDDDDD